MLDFLLQVMQLDPTLRSDIATLKSHNFIREKPKADELSVSDFIVYGYMKKFIPKKDIRKIVRDGELIMSTIDNTK